MMYKGVAGYFSVLISLLLFFPVQAMEDDEIVGFGILRMSRAGMLRQKGVDDTLRIDSVKAWKERQGQQRSTNGQPSNVGNSSLGSPDSNASDSPTSVSTDGLNSSKTPYVIPSTPELEKNLNETVNWLKSLEQGNAQGAGIPKSTIDQCREQKTVLRKRISRRKSASKPESTIFLYNCVRCCLCFSCCGPCAGLFLLCCSGKNDVHPSA